MKYFGVLIAATLLAWCLCAQAQEPRAMPSPPPSEPVHYGWADVLRVDPVYDDNGAAGPVPAREECYEEQRAAPPPPDNRAGSTIAGAIIGGVIGHSFGKGSGRAAATAAGVAAGAAIGNNVAAQQENAERGYVTERRCRTVESAPPRRIVAYDVEYRYRGELYTARMTYDPGDRVRVRISVMPAE